MPKIRTENPESKKCERGKTAKAAEAHSSVLAWRIPMDGGAWQATVHGVTESDTTEQLSAATVITVIGKPQG